MFGCRATFYFVALVLGSLCHWRCVELKALAIESLSPDRKQFAGVVALAVTRGRNIMLV